MRLKWVLALPTLLGRFRRAQGGNIAVVFGLAGLVLTGVVGGAVDFGMAVGQRSKLQAALDAAVLAGARSEADKTAKAKRNFSANISSLGYSSVKSSFVMEGNKLIGTASADVPTALLRVASINDIEVDARAVAMINASKVCVLLLDPAAREAFKANGSGEIDMPDCEMHVTSNARPATWIDSRRIDTAKLCIKGTSGGNLRPLPDSFVENCTPMPDPFAGTFPIFPSVWARRWPALPISPIPTPASWCLNRAPTAAGRRSMGTSRTWSSCPAIT